MHRLLGKRGPDDPYVPPQNPFEVFLLGISMFAAWPLLKGDSGSAVVESYLQDGAVIMLGSIFALIGLYLPQKYALLGLYLERSGLILSGGAAAIYAYVVYKQALNPDDVRYIVSMQFGYAAACSWRCIQLTRGIHWSKTHPMMRGR